IAVSQFIASRLRAQGFPDEKIRQHYVGIDVQKFTPDASASRQQMVLFTGRLVEKKGCEHLIRAMADVQASAPDCELVIIGDGPLRVQLETLAKTTLRRVRFL